MFKYLNRASFDAEQEHYLKGKVYDSYTSLIEDKRIVSERKTAELKGKFFASTSEDTILTRLLGNL